MLFTLTFWLSAASALSPAPLNTVFSCCLDRNVTKSNGANEITEGIMAQTTQSDPTYVLGRSSAETQRLMLPSDLTRRFTRQVFVEAGITPGMCNF
jgi:hypothetical protein